MKKAQVCFWPLSAAVSRWWNCFAPPSITAMSRKSSKKSHAQGLCRIYPDSPYWTVGIPDVPKLFMGSPIQDRDMARGTLMALFLSTTVFPAETIQIPVYVETCVLLDDLMAGGWYA